MVRALPGNSDGVPGAVGLSLLVRSCPGRLRSARMGTCVLDSECAQDREWGRAAIPGEASAQGEMRERHRVC